MRSKLMKDISASSAQVIFNQAAGFVIFIILSTYLDKAIYGELNWSFAVLVLSTTIMSFRLEQVIVRKVAVGESASRLLTLFTGHVIITGFLFLLVITICSILFPVFFTAHNLLLYLAFSQLMTFFASPFRQITNGREKFNYLAIMSTVANVVRLVLLLIVIYMSTLTASIVLQIYIASSLIELIVSFCIIRFRMNIPFEGGWSFKNYFALLKESLPQIGTVFLNAGIARLDWILLGILTTSMMTAEYSFAYKVFELSPFLLMIIAPILLSRMSRLFASGDEAIIFRHQTAFQTLIRIEIVAAFGIALLLNMCWVPVMEALTVGKYGTSNQVIFLLLSVCIPLQFAINILWSVHFSLNRLRLIFRVTAISFLVMLIADLFLIPAHGGTGAAIGYLLGQTTEYILFLRTSLLRKFSVSWQSLIIGGFNGITSGLIAWLAFDPLWVRLPAAFVLYTGLSVITMQLRRNDILLFRQLLGLKPITIETRAAI